MGDSRRQSIDPEAAELPLSEPWVWVDRVRAALAARSPDAADIVAEALRACPGHDELLLLAALTALADRSPERALVHLKRFQKRYGAQRPGTLLTALAAAQQGHMRH